MNKIKIGNKFYSPFSVRFFQVFFLLIGILITLMGLLLLLISFFFGVVSVLFGIFSISLSIKYSKLLKEYKCSQTHNTSSSTNAETDIKLNSENKTDIVESDADISVNSLIAESLVESSSLNDSSKENVVPTESDAEPHYTSERHNIAGTSFRQDEIKDLGTYNDDYDMTKKEIIDSFMYDEKIYQFSFCPHSVVLEEEPDNPHDPNAIKLLIDNVHVGYIKRGSCAHVKKLIRNDKIKSLTASIYGGKYKIVKSEFDDEKFEEVYKLEKGESDFFVSLYITLK